MSTLQVQITSDGSTTLWNAELDETYHSRHGAATESVHVFIRNGLDHWLEMHPQAKQVRVFEMGFGTGLNMLLAWSWAEAHDVVVRAVSVEAFPLTREIWEQLTFPGMDSSRIQRVHEASWEKESALTAAFHLTKQQSDLRGKNLSQAQFDVIFYDAFAPSRQPDLWDEAMIRKMAAALAPGGVWATYCAQGQLKRNLRAAGLVVESLPGPPGKREMVRALRP